MTQPARSGYFARSYFGRTWPGHPPPAPNEGASGGASGVVLPFIRPARIFTVQAHGGLHAGGMATIATTQAMQAHGGLDLGGMAAAATIKAWDRWAKAREEDELWLLLLD